MDYPEKQTTKSRALSVLRKTKLKTRMILTLGLLGTLQTVLIGSFAGYYLSESL